MPKTNQWKPNQHSVGNRGKNLNVTEIHRQKIEYKWKFAVGTTSRIPNSKLHYLILDIDTQTDPPIGCGRKYKFNSWFVQRTENGFHVYTDLKLRFDQMEIAMKYFGADPSWIRIGLKRGYWFLADKQPVILPWPTERMALHFDPSRKKKLDDGIKL